MKFKKTKGFNLKSNSIFGKSNAFPIDVDGNGIVDGSGSNAYQLYSIVTGGNAVTLTNRGGQTFNDSTSPNWNATQASTYGSEAGFQVLLEGSGANSGRYLVWSTDVTGQIIDGSGWKNASEMSSDGYDEIFNRDFNGDGSIDLPEPGDWDDNGIIDGSENTAYAFYELHNGGAPIELTSTRGKTFNHDSNRNWDAIQAVTHDSHDGFLVLLEGADKRDGKFYVWATNPQGIVQDGSGWKTASQMEAEGYGEIFNRTFDGSTPPPPEPPIEEPPAEEPPIEEPPAEEPPAEEPPVSDDYGSTPETSGSLEMDSEIRGNVEVGGDRDWFSINLDAGSSYKFDLKHISVGDPYLRLYDIFQRVVTENDDGAGGLDSRIIFNPTQGGTYYLDAGAYNETFTGEYLLTSETLPSTPEGYSYTNGYGNIDAKRTFESLLDVSLPDVQDLPPEMWNLDQVNVPEVWSLGYTGSDVVVSVIDTGIDLDHPEFTGRIVPGYDFVDDDSVPEDGNSHGTHVAGVIAAADNFLGVSGVAPDAKIMPVRVLNDNGSGSISNVISGIRWSADNGADVINLSLGGGGYSQAMADTLQYASNRGSTVVMAAGNEWANSPSYPAAHASENGIAVGAVDSNQNMPTFSNRAGLEVLDYVTAPGVDIYSTVIGGQYSFMSGTSMASPHVAGLAALIKNYDSSMSASAIEDLITGSSSNHTYAQQIDDELITAKSIDSFSNKQLKKPLIAKLSGGKKSRKNSINSMSDYDVFDSFEVIENTNKTFAVLDLKNSKKIDRGSILENLLDSGQVDYFEFDQMMVAI
jgi:subtilisin family serine protease